MTAEKYKELLTLLAEVGSWQDPDETLPIERRKEIFAGFADTLRKFRSALPDKYHAELDNLEASLRRRMDDDGGWLNHPSVVRLSPEIKGYIRAGLREGRQQALKSAFDLLKNILAEVAASGEVTSSGV